MAKVGLVSLGCPKNLVDSEVMLGLLNAGGHEITSQQEEADILIVNTCGFIASAKQESVDTILEMAAQKTAGRCRKLIVAGCLVERYRADIMDQIPEVDAVVGTNQIPDILRACSDEFESAPPQYEERELYLYSDTDPRIVTTARHTAYIKIAEGCDHPCSFCVIPKMRGHFRSRAPESILAEARRLAEAGVRELNLVGQDTTMYGWDLGDPHGLANLIRKLDGVEGIEWVRFLYAYPNNIYNDLLDSIAETPKACKYIDVPLQHASSRVLKAMKRGGNRHSLNRLVERIRRHVPEVAIRTTMIVGFPGETEDDFGQLLNFVKDSQFDRLGVFTFSDEEDATSAGLGGKVEEAVKEDRQRRLMKIQAEISRKKNGRLVGQTVPVMLEGLSKESDLLWEGRMSTQAPDIDGVVYLTDGITEQTQPGEIRSVRVEEAHEHDLVGVVTG